MWICIKIWAMKIKAYILNVIVEGSDSKGEKEHPIGFEMFSSAPSGC